MCSSFALFGKTLGCPPLVLLGSLKNLLVMVYLLVWFLLSFTFLCFSFNRQILFLFVKVKMFI